MRTPLRIMMLGSLLVMATSCASITSALLAAKEKVEVLVGQQGPGLYTITADKDGKQIFQQQVRCDQGPDGKLSGCHPL